MTRIAKLYSRLIASTKITLSFREFEQLLRAFGFEEVRQRGSHRMFEHTGCGATLTIQPIVKHAAPYQVRQFLDIVEQYRLSLDDR